MARRRRKRDKEKSAKGWREPSLVYLVVAALLLSLIAGILLRSDLGTRLGIPGAYVWVTGLFIAFFLRVAQLARFVLPLEADEPSGSTGNDTISGVAGWLESLRMVLYHFGVLALRAPAEQSPEGDDASVPPSVPATLATFRAGFVDSHLALALAKDTEFARAAGPGYVSLNRGERISHVIDLRRQTCREPVEAMTRDGIPLQTSITVSFQVRNPESETETVDTGSFPYPYDPDAIFRLTFAEGVGSDAEIPWSERLCPVASANLIAEIARYRLDQLYQPVDPEAARDTVPIEQVVADVRRRLVRQLMAMFDCVRSEECPVEILSVNVGPLEPPEDVVDQRIRDWQSAWQRRLEQYDDESKFEETVHIQKARTRAAMTLIDDLIREIEITRQQSELELGEIITKQMIETIDAKIGERRGKPESPEGSRDDLAHASAWLKQITSSKRLT